ncbi:hypothetical protein E1283_29750, partial [Streptomyces hainanensis]
MQRLPAAPQELREPGPIDHHAFPFLDAPSFLPPPRPRIHGSPIPPWDPADAVTANCLATVLAQVRDTGWTHHIPRLMVLGSHALQRGWDP